MISVRCKDFGSELRPSDVVLDEGLERKEGLKARRGVNILELRMQM